VLPCGFYDLVDVFLQITTLKCSVWLIVLLYVTCYTSLCLLTLATSCSSHPVQDTVVFLCGSVVEHCVSCAKGCGFDSQGTHVLKKMYNLNAIVSRFG